MVGLNEPGPVPGPIDDVEDLGPFDRLGSWAGVLARLMDGESLSSTEAATVMGEILNGQATPAQIGGLLVALRVKGESVEEMTGLVRAMVDHAVPLELVGDPVDLVGTGGDRLHSINVTTLAACIVAGAGAKVCKHGNRAASSSVGTADVLEALGAVVDLGPEGVLRCVEEAGFGFCFAPRFHAGFRHAAPVRRELGVATVFNFLGPLAHPGRPVRQVVGVSDPVMAPKMAGVLAANGSRRAMVVFADDGLDELSTTGPSTVIELTADGNGRAEIREWRLDPTSLGFPLCGMADLRGGDAAFNAAAIHRVLDGARGPHRDIGVLNAAAGLVVAGVAQDLADGVARATDAVDGGAAAAALEGLVATSTSVASPGREA